jgi:hypothetical protein
MILTIMIHIGVQCTEDGGILTIQAVIGIHGDITHGDTTRGTGIHGITIRGIIHGATRPTTTAHGMAEAIVADITHTTITIGMITIVMKGMKMLPATGVREILMHYPVVAVAVA